MLGKQKKYSGLPNKPQDSIETEPPLNRGNSDNYNAYSSPYHSITRAQQNNDQIR